MYSEWVNIFRLKRFNFIVIEIKNNKDRQKLSQKHKSSWDSSFFTILPDTHEVESFQPNDYVKKYTLTLKKFMEDDKINCLITDQLILGAIIKKEKKENFLNFLMKKNKKLILLAEPGITDIFENHKKKTIIITEDTFNQKLYCEDSFKIIKKRLSFIYSPFSDPIGTYEKMALDSFKRTV